MPKPFQTLQALPDPSHRRFSLLQLGWDKVAECRDEFTALREVAAAACGVRPEELTHDHLTAFNTRLAAAAAACDDNDPLYVGRNKDAALALSASALAIARRIDGE